MAPRELSTGPALRLIMKQAASAAGVATAAQTAANAAQTAADDAQNTGDGIIAEGYNPDAWTPFTLVLSAGLGSITTYVSSANNGYKVLGKTCHYRAAFTITNKGTASTYLLAKLSALPAPNSQEISEPADGYYSVTGDPIKIAGFITQNVDLSPQVLFDKYDGTSAVDNASYFLRGTYEIA